METTHAYELLLDINRRENPQALPRLEELIARGTMPDKLALLCDELGRLRYENRRDPNALANRFAFVEMERSDRLPPRPPHPSTSFLDKGYYYPSIKVVEETRALTALQVREATTLKAPSILRTAADYKKHIEQFHPNTLGEILLNLHAIELSDGCNGPCRSTCALPVKSRAQHHIPFEFLQWFFETHAEILKKTKNGVMLYHASDLADYEDSGKTAADVLELYRKYIGHCSYVSTVFRLDDKAVDFLLELLEREMPISRISRLVSGKAEEDSDRLIAKLQKRAEIKGYQFTDSDAAQIQIAFSAGNKKRQRSHIAGNVVRDDTEEREIVDFQIPCAHGTMLLAGSGFAGKVLRPHSRAFPHGEISFPIAPDSKGTILIPRKTTTYDLRAPYGMYQGGFVPRPRFVKIDSATGAVLERQKRTANESALINFSALYYELSTYDFNVQLEHPDTGQLTRKLQIQLENMPHNADQKGLEACKENIEWLDYHADYNLEYFKKFDAHVRKLFEKYRTYPSALFQLNQIIDLAAKIFIEECELSMDYFKKNLLHVEQCAKNGAAIELCRELLCSKGPAMTKKFGNFTKVLTEINAVIEDINEAGGEELDALAQSLSRQYMIQRYAAAIDEARKSVLEFLLRNAPFALAGAPT